MQLQHTSLIEVHKKYQGKMIDFGGWELPVHYIGVIKEHHMVREKAGLFDVSHMGEISVKGERAEEFLNYLLTNNIKQMKPWQVQYNLMCYETGGVVDDLLVYKFNEQNYLLVVNAANTEKDFLWIKEKAFPSLEIANVSADYAQLSIQGNLAQSILQKICDIDLEEIKFFYFQPAVQVAGQEAIISRTGYTGEDGFEIYVAPHQAEKVWEAILSAGEDDICPIGLGARDTLRFEAKLPLYGQEIDQDITPLEAGLGFFVKLNKGDFIGSKVLLEQKANGTPRKLVEFVMTGRGIPRTHYEVQKNGKKIGYVTSGNYAPFIDKNIGLALLEQQYSEAGTAIDIIIRGKKIPAEIGEGIFYKKKTKSKQSVEK